MRYFFSTGEASGELNATLLAQSIGSQDAQAAFEGIGADRMRQAGFRLWRDHTGWASMGPLAAIPRIPKLLTIMYRTAAHIARSKPDLVILVDFGAFNVRLAKRLRAIGYPGPVLDVFPPAAWLDDERRAREISSVATPLTAFAHQRDFFRSLDLPVAYFGHPLVSHYKSRPPRSAAPPLGGTVALLPGSRAGEIRYNAPALFEAFARLRAQRPQLRGIIGAADESAERLLRHAVRRGNAHGIDFARGTAAAVMEADAAWVASGTAVLECALLGVPCVALYIISPALAKHARRVYSGRFIALPNLVLEREVIPECLQEAATPERLASAMASVLDDPRRQQREFAELRSALGPADALERCAAFAIALAKEAAS